LMSFDATSLFSLTCASSKEALKRGFEVDDIENHVVSYRILPQDEVSIVIPSDHGVKLVRATWGISIKGEPTVHRIGAKQALSKRPFSILIRKSRCMVPVNCLVYTRSNHSPTLLRVLGQRIVGLGGLYTEAKSLSGIKYETCLFETTAPDILTSITKTLPTIFAPEKGLKWITPSTLEEVFYRSERTNGYWFDYFSIAPDFVDLDNPRANSLSPEGISMYEQKRRTEKLREIEIEKTRQNRSGK
jgi:putative SOS response-associated peptidase YedK